MPTSNTVDWTDPKWADTITQSMAATAKCRSVLPKGADQIGVNTVTVPTFGAGLPLAYGVDAVQSTLQLLVDINIDDQHAADDTAATRLIQYGGASLGALEDVSIVTGGAPAGCLPRSPGLPLGFLLASLPVAVPVPIGAGAKMPNGQQIMAAVSMAMGALSAAGRPGGCGLLLRNDLVAVLNLPAVAGGAPVIQAVEQLIGGNQIVGTGAFNPAANVCGVLFRLSPSSVEVVQTQSPHLTVLGRAGGITSLRVEEDVAVRVLDPMALQFIVI